MTSRFRKSKSNDDLQDAVKCLSEAKNILPPGHPNYSATGSELASLLLIQCDIVSDLDESLRIMTEAFELYEHAANHSPLPVRKSDLMLL